MIHQMGANPSNPSFIKLQVQLTLAARGHTNYIGAKLPALVNASLTLVPGDGIYCFGMTADL